MLFEVGYFMSVIRYTENPFVEGMIIPKKGKFVKLSKLGRDENVLINNETGEHFGTHVTTIKQVDSEQFVKLFTANIALTFELTSAGIKTLNVLVWEVQKNGLMKDLVILDMDKVDEFLRSTGVKTLSRNTFMKGLSELVSNKIIARYKKQGWFYINPNFIFNGDRIAFTTVIERKKTEARDTKTIDMFGED